MRTSDNCYVVEPNKQELGTCFMSQKDDTNLWHQRLGRLNFRDLAKVSKKEIVKDLLRLKKIDNPLCKGCQMGKQTRVPHKKTTQVGTSRP